MLIERPWKIAGGILLGSGILHGLLLLILGGGWDGPVSWRKPMLFGISTGLTVFSLGWVQSKLSWKRRDRLWAAIIPWGLVVEVGIVTLQTWRGVPSHFNRGTPIDASLHVAMDLLIAVASMGILDFTFRSLRGIRAEPAMARAIQGGMVFLSLSVVMGFVILILGEIQVAQGLAPETFGKRGVLKFPHGMTIHAIQWLPFLEWRMRQHCKKIPQRLRSIHLAILGTGLLQIYSLVQTFSGRSRMELQVETFVVLACCTVCFGGAILTSYCRSKSLRQPLRSR